MSNARKTLIVSIFLLTSKVDSLANKPHPSSRTPKIITSRKDDGSLSTSYNFLLDHHDGINIIQQSSSPSKKNGLLNNNQRSKSPLQLMGKMKSIVKTTFLPSGFPQRTPKGYLSYSMWSWIQDLSTQLRAVLATQRVLEGIGVGRQGATALSASLNFIIRDGCGMASTLIFTALASSKFRTDVKRWRIVADVMNDVGITLEVAATLVPSQLFLPMICKSNLWYYVLSFLNIFL